MAGQIKKLIDKIIDVKSGGNKTLVMTTKTKLVLKGVNPDNFTAASPDDPEIIDKLKQIAAQMGVQC